MTASSEYGRFVRPTTLAALTDDDPMSVDVVRDQVVNNLLHANDEIAQHCVNACYEDGEEPGLQPAEAAEEEFLRSFGPFSARVRSDGESFAFVVRVAGKVGTSGEEAGFTAYLMRGDADVNTALSLDSANDTTTSTSNAVVIEDTLEADQWDVARAERERETNNPHDGPSRVVVPEFRVDVWISSSDVGGQTAEVSVAQVHVREFAS